MKIERSKCSKHGKSGYYTFSAHKALIIFLLYIM